MTLELQAHIRRRMRAGGSFDAVEEEIIDRCGLDGDRKAALWLYAWSFVPQTRHRRGRKARCVSRFHPLTGSTSADRC